MIVVVIVLSGAGPRPIVYAQENPDAAYQEALELILEAKDSGATELDLSGMGLAELPPEIG